MAVSSFRELKRIVTVEQVLASRGLLGGLRVRGGDLVGPCPLHGGDNPGAFVVSRSKSLWRCFTSCGGGDVVELITRLDGSGYRDARRVLQRLAGERDDDSGPLQDRFSSRSAPQRASRAFTPYTRRLALDPAAPMLMGKGIDAATAARFEAGAWHGPGFLSGCVGVRLHDVDGQPLGYAGRRISVPPGSQIGKWKFPPRLPKAALLYGWHRVGRDGRRGLVVVEGAWSVLRLAQVGVPAVALLGAHASAQQCGMLAAAGRVVVMLDGDRAGRAGARRLVERLGGRRDVRVIELGDGVDPDDLDDEELAGVCGLLLS